MSESLREQMRPLRTGARAWFYRGRRRARAHHVGHLASGLALLEVAFR